MSKDSSTLEKIAAAFDLVSSGVSKRIDGEGFKVYSMTGTGLVRVDIDSEKVQALTS